MSDMSKTSQLTDRANSRWVRLRTLIALRWVAIIGQSTAIAISILWFNLNINLGLCALVISASAAANLAAMFIYPENKRMSERGMTLTLTFDLVQLGALLFLTGGLNNPFALLILAPVTIAATTLSPQSTISVAAVAAIITSILARFYQPLHSDLGFVMRMPSDFLLGFWGAIVIGTVFLAIYAQRVSSEIGAMSRALLATQMALGREQKLTDLAGVVAATAHELGTPLATIKLTSAELAQELEDRPELREDAELIREQADRCRDILHSMGRAGKDDKHLAHAPFSAVVQAAAEPHIDRGTEVVIARTVPDDLMEPEIIRFPEIVHGVRNLIQNAVDFSMSTVWVDMSWSDKNVILRIIDDGAGYAPNVIGRIGDPFVGRRRRTDDRKERPGYEGMGLGLFIAKTLLERTGAELSFANARDAFSPRPKPGERSGAIVEVAWPRRLLEPEPMPTRKALGENELFQP